MAELGDGRYKYWNGKTGIGCSDYVKLALRKAGIISETESLWAGQSYEGVLADKTRFERIPWSPNDLRGGDILWSHGHHVAVWAGDKYKSVYEAAPESSHPVAECGTGVGLHRSHTYYNCGDGTYKWTCIFRIIENTDDIIDVSGNNGSTSKKKSNTKSTTTGGNSSLATTKIKSLVLRQRVIDVCLGKYGKTEYNNTYPWNVGKFSNGVWTFDCLGFVHTLVNGFTGDKLQLGGGAVMDEFVLACNEASTLATCTNVRKFNGVEPKQMALLQSSGHVGFYIGNYEVKRKNGTVDVYNVAECTPAWSDGCQLSWVDIGTGYRYNKKGGQYRSIWNYHGELGRVDYTDQKQTEPIMPEPIEPKAESKEKLNMAQKLEIALDIVQGKGNWGSNPGRKEKLTKLYGSDVAIQIQDIINLADK